MRQFFICCILVFGCHAAFAQPSAKELEKHRKEVAESLSKGSVVWSLDTVFNAGVPYCLLTRDGKGLLLKGYNVFNLIGDELIYVNIEHYDQPNGQTASFYAFNFLETGQTAEINPSLESDYIAKQIVKNNLIKDDMLNPTGVNKMVQVYGTKLSAKANLTAPAPANPGNYYADKYSGMGTGTQKGNKYGTVVNAYIIGGDVKINTTEVGSLREEQKAEAGGIIKRKFFYDTAGNIVAECSCAGVNCQDWTVRTPTDRRQHSVSTSFGREAQGLAVWLAKNGYY